MHDYITSYGFRNVHGTKVASRGNNTRDTSNSAPFQVRRGDIRIY